MIPFQLKIIALIFALGIFGFKARSQSGKTSVHAEQANYFSQFDLKSEADWDEFNKYQPEFSAYKKTKTVLNREVFGWHPYWSGTMYYDYNFNLLSEVSYFSYEVNPQTGKPDNIHYWLTTELVDVAQQSGKRVSLTATLFSQHETFFSNSQAVSTFIDSIVSLVEYRQADGINIDFESIPGSQRDNLTAMMNQLNDALHSYNPDARLSIALPAVDWSNSFDVFAMRDAVDLFIIMGYEYYWSGSSSAGPGSPKNGGDIWGNYNTTTSIRNYLNKGVNPDKLCLAVPYYGREWTTEDDEIPSATTSSGSPVIYRSIMEEYQNYNYFEDPHSSTPVYIYEDGGEIKQCWFNNAWSNGLKYDYINLKNIAGIGIWALGYDYGFPKLEEMIKEKFSDQGNTFCSGTFTDTGGPEGDYYNSEDWYYTIAPKDAQNIYLKIKSFNTEAGYDTLYIFDGINPSAPLLYKLSGTDFPADAFSAGSAVCFYFNSDHATTREGWEIEWSCTEFQDITEISDSQIQVIPNPFCSDFKVFTGEKNKLSKYEIWDLSGKKIVSGKIKEKQTKIKPHIKAGVYILKLLGNDVSISKKIIKTE